MAGEIPKDVPDDVQRWTAKRRVALVLSILKGETSVAEATGGTPVPLESFRAFVAAGEKLAKLHLDYEKLDPWPLKQAIKEGAKNAELWRVEKMRLSKDKKSLTVNEWVTLDGIPPRCFEYRLGNRSALEWVIDQYQKGVTTKVRIAPFL